MKKHPYTAPGTYDILGQVIARIGEGCLKAIRAIEQIFPTPACDCRRAAKLACVIAALDRAAPAVLRGRQALPPSAKRWLRFAARP